MEDAEGGGSRRSGGVRGRGGRSEDREIESSTPIQHNYLWTNLHIYQNINVNIIYCKYLFWHYEKITFLYLLFCLPFLTSISFI